MATGTQKKKGYINSTDLVLIALASAFFPRLLMLIKIPSAINFLHFVVVPLAFGVILITSRSKNPKQLQVSKQILFALLLLLTVGFASALLNGVGVINVVLHFLMFNEPAMLLLAIVAIPMSVEKLRRFRNYVLGFGFFNLIFALIQIFVLRWDIRGRSPCPNLDGVDTITGVFTCQGAGVIVSASVSLALVIYFLVAQKNCPIWLRILVVIGCFLQIVIADAKQVLIVAGVAFGLMSLTNVKDVRKTILIVIGLIVGFQVFWWAIFNFEFLEAFAGWVRPDIYGPDGEATKFKMFGVNAILTHMNSPWNQLFGLGPGHTIDRLGMVMLKEYGNLLNPLGATRTTLSDEVWSNMEKSWLANGSTMFSPFFGWAALWGDLGVLGLSAYFYLYFLIWRYIATDDLSKFQMLSVFVVGFIQAGLQEPGFMLYVAALLGLRWQEINYKNQQKYLRLQAI
ncbi:MAG: hypothetical protein MUD14_08935 [Hydrococcus sp. Prado102]|nr:hypothetical protein [Hydrococcus sp. Prado102]